MSTTTPDTKTKLIDAALDLIWKGSYGSVSVDDICRAADVRKGSFYHYFPSKVDLALAVMEESHRLMEPEFDVIFSPRIPALQRFERFADFVYRSQSEAAAKYHQVCGCPCTSLGSEMAGQEACIRDKYEEITRRKERYYQNALRDMIAEGLLPPQTDVNAVAEEINTYIIGQLVIARIQNNLEHLKRDLKIGLLKILGVER
ncbi:TetR/AcrR family transcriptional regulator [Geobacter sp. SVR]|uniref:TetR/AcrR family transcriptional regulator n=1 Tax=Geobacter sp. SVR TaxID=2495594 RepID=UPI00143F011B|nr:TetR/AcrR family transcriptional regulator [Geobacter sp. SVR]BCS55276.1 TetR family transcriptional regulator [Geobacter sp. SVR]GCF86075.1 TetR family transcriptional regulator [Geobacter sp. SVR]